MATTDLPAPLLAARLRAVSRIAVAAMIPLVFFFTTRGTWNPREENVDAAWSAGFFRSQAESMLRGRLDVKPADIIGECFDRDARCYGYFGVTPSALRIPFLGLLRYFRSALTPVYLGMAVLLAYWAALQMLQRGVCASPHVAESPYTAVGYFIVCAAALGPAGSLFFVARPAVYEEAIAWGVAFVLLAFNHVWSWHSGERRSLLPAVVFAVAAANARPTAAVVAGVLGTVIAVLWFCRNPRAFGGPDRGVGDNGPRGVDADRQSARRILVAACCLAVLPGLTAGGVFWLKLRSPMPSPMLNEQVRTGPHWKEIRKRNGGRTAGLMFAPTELVAYFRPDAVVWRPEWPYVDFRFPDTPILWVPPLPEGGAYVERLTSLTATMPLPWIVNLLVAAWLGVEAWGLWSGNPSSTPAPALTRDEWIFSAGLLASAAAMPVLIVTTHGLTNRYLGDFFPTSAVGVALGSRLVLPFLAPRPFARAAAGVIALLLVGWSTVVTLALTTRLVF